MYFDVLTTFPEMVEGPLSASILGRAQQAGIITIRIINIRDFATDKHRTTDDYPFGGGAGMVMKVEPVVAAVEHAKSLPPGDVGQVVLMSPQGETLTHELAVELSQLPRLIIVCGHYEGVDERVCELVIDREISIGDYVLTGGELPAAVLIDAVARQIAGVLGDARSSAEDSFAGDGLLDYPHYTRPREFRGLKVPEVLLSGNHGAVARWRRERALERTLRRRPDLLARARLTEEDRAFLRRLGWEPEQSANNA